MLNVSVAAIACVAFVTSVLLHLLHLLIYCIYYIYCIYGAVFILYVQCWDSCLCLRLHLDLYMHLFDDQERPSHLLVVIFSQILSEMQPQSDYEHYILSWHTKCNMHGMHCAACVGILGAITCWNRSQRGITARAGSRNLLRSCDK